MPPGSVIEAEQRDVRKQVAHLERWTELDAARQENDRTLL